MTEITLNDVNIKFPFKPYKVQEDYMSKVIECLQDGKNGVLESPTGTGKTLCLLCSSLAWLITKKAQIQMQGSFMTSDNTNCNNEFVDDFTKNLNKGAGKITIQSSNSFRLSMPKIIYASRTHSQLSQAMQELKRTSYNHVNTAVLGSRDQLCIHPEVAKEENSSNKVHMCQIKVKTRNCFYYNEVEKKKDDPIVRESILDIEDLVKKGQKLRCCPYFLSRSLKDYADIIFMPYNYLLDPRTRKNQGIDLQNSIILLDEAHNVEKMCEEAASLQIGSTDIAVCIEEITIVMRDLNKANGEENEVDSTFNVPNSVQQDFSKEDLCILKTMFLELEKAIDAIEIKNREEGETFPGGYIFDILAKADIMHGKEQLVIDKLDKIILYLTTVSTSQLNRKGNSLQKFCDLLRVVFAGPPGSTYRDKVKNCYKVYIQIEQPKKTFKNDAWETKKLTKSDGKLISYWCFSPGFGMQQLLDQGVRCVILTSGTLSPLRPFISEIGIDIAVQLENPHIISAKQICVGIISKGFDGTSLNSSFNTRNDPKYIASLGETIRILSSILPNGLLIFFPSYPIMKNCQAEWQKMGKWSQIEACKPIFVEPQSKTNFNSIMSEYYKKIYDPTFKGAIFMAVCRGKVSEGLDFANANGRAVIITGLPFPPLKDPRVILKQRYLEENRASGKESLTGQQWYQLEASRAVNQAIGRIIRHQYDYGAILLCDCRFENTSFKQQLSAWIRPHITKFENFKSVLKDLRMFFNIAKTNWPQDLKNVAAAMNDTYLPSAPAEFDTSGTRALKSSSKLSASNLKTDDEKFDFKMYLNTENNKSEKNSSNNSKSSFSSLLEAKAKEIVDFTGKLQNVPTTFQKTSNSVEPSIKRRKLIIKSVDFTTDTTKNLGASTSSASERLDSQQIKVNKQNVKITDKQEHGKNYLSEVKKSLSLDDFNIFRDMITKYKSNNMNFQELLFTLKKLFIINYNLKHLFIGFRTFLKKDHLKTFEDHIKSMEE